MNIDELKAKWGGSLPQEGDWIANPLDLDHRIQIGEGFNLGLFRRISAPIPLTRDVLEKIKEAGPVYIPEPNFGEECIECRFCNPHTEVLLFTIRIYPNGESHLFRRDLGFENPYLHHVQQLYRIFTKGKELTYQP